MPASGGTPEVTLLNTAFVHQHDAFCAGHSVYDVDEQEAYIKMRSLAESLETRLIAALSEGAIHLENFKTTNRAYIAADNARQSAEAALKLAQQTHAEYVKVLGEMEDENDKLTAELSALREAGEPIAWQCKRGMAVSYVYDAASAERAANPVKGALGLYGEPWSVTPLYAHPPLSREGIPERMLAEAQQLDPADAKAIAGNLWKLYGGETISREGWQWVPVGERLPPDAKPVLIQAYYGDEDWQDVAWWGGTVWTSNWKGQKYRPDQKVTHWMPIVAPAADSQP